MNGSRNAPPTALPSGQRIICGVNIWCLGVILADDVRTGLFGPPRLGITLSPACVLFHLEALLGSGIAASLAGLRCRITAGEPLPKNLVDRFKQLLPAHDC